MDRTGIRETIEKVLELIGSIDCSDTLKRKCNQRYLNTAYDLLFDLRKQIKKEETKKY